MHIHPHIRKALGSTALRQILVDAALGVVCGALYGMVFGGFKGIGANDADSLILGAVGLGGLGGVAVAACGLCFATQSAAKPESQPATIP